MGAAQFWNKFFSERNKKEKKEKPIKEKKEQKEDFKEKMIIQKPDKVKIILLNNSIQELYRITNKNTKMN